MNIGLFMLIIGPFLGKSCVPGYHSNGWYLRSKTLHVYSWGRVLSYMSEWGKSIFGSFSPNLNPYCQPLLKCIICKKISNSESTLEYFICDDHNTQHRDNDKVCFLQCHTKNETYQILKSAHKRCTHTALVQVLGITQINHFVYNLKETKYVKKNMFSFASHTLRLMMKQKLYYNEICDT